MTKQFWTAQKIDIFVSLCLCIALAGSFQEDFLLSVGIESPKLTCLRIMCMMWPWHRLTLDHRQSSALKHRNPILSSLELPSIMSDETGTSILDGALACIGQRITTIFLQPGNKDKNYIASFHNEVVSIIQCPK